jgi:thioredoxin reductase/Fe-S-cluster-containing hydrogenase component 2
MLEREVVVVGAGPAGLAAAIAAARAGAQTLLVDEHDRPGGQLFKQIHKFFGSRDHRAGVRGMDIGTQLLAEAEALGVEVWLDSAVWGLFPGHRLGILRGDRSVFVQTGQVILATGAMENALTFPGWTLPGVMTAGAAQTLLNLYRVLPGRRALMVGAGNVGLIVAYQYLQAGGEVAAIVEAMPTIGGYGVHASKVRRAGVPLLTGHTILEAEGEDQVESVIIAQVDRDFRPLPDTERRLEADTVLLAVGLTPMAELAQLAGCEFTFIPSLGGQVPVHDERMETSVPGIFVAGDISGIEEASSAMEEGQVAGIAAATALGYLSAKEARVQAALASQRLDELRLGQFGEKRARAKALQVQCAKAASAPLVDARTTAAAARSETTRGGVAATGVPSVAELEASPGYPTPERLARGPVAVVECVQEIPCNPCEVACPTGAIVVGQPITNLPYWRDVEACTGCGLCIAACPGLAIFGVDVTYGPEEALVSIPYEYRPLPGKGDRVPVTSRQGQVLGAGRVVRVRCPRSFDRTAVISVAVPRALALEARGIRVGEAPDG